VTTVGVRACCNCCRRSSVTVRNYRWSGGPLFSCVTCVAVKQKEKKGYVMEDGGASPVPVKKKKAKIEKSIKKASPKKAATKMKSAAKKPAKKKSTAKK
jgi:acyl-CoA hydrolase